jgi:hypothetical protein
MWRSRSFWSSDTSRWPRLALRIAAAASIGLLVACSGQEDTASGTVGTNVPASPSGATPSAPTAAETAPTQVAAIQPKIEKKTVVEIRTIPFKKTTAKDSSLVMGKAVVTTRGVRGKKRLTYEVALTNGVQTGKRLLREVIIARPIAQVTSVGTKVEPKPADKCDPNYGGACVPIASDVDCAGGSGNGPAYVRGPVRVVGVDIYDLDGNDNDGIGCE